MAVLDNIFPCSFRNVPVFWKGPTKTTGGNKTVVHEFINSNIRNVENLGPLQKTFSLPCFVFGDDYIVKRDRLITALEQPGKGILVHPTFGRVEVVLSQPYTITEDDSELGIASFDLTFSIANDVAEPQPDVNTIAAISEKSDTLNLTLAANTSSKFSVGTFFRDSFKSAETLLNSLSDEMNSVVDLFSPANELVAELSSSISNFQSSITDLLSQPTSLANGILGLFEQANGILDVPVDQLNTIKNLFSFNSASSNLTTNTDVGNSVTEETAEIVENEKTLTLQVRMTALSFAYVNASRITFTNIQVLDNTASLLEEQFNVLIQDQFLPNEVRLAAQDLRTSFESFLAEKRLSVKLIQSVSVKQMPLQVLAYALYKDSSFASQLADLNDINDVSHASGTIEVFTS